MKKLKKTLNLPRSPLPSKTGGPMRTRRNELARKAKHKRPPKTDPAFY